MGGGVVVEGEENRVYQQARHVRVEKQVLGILIMGAALRFNVKCQGALERCLGNHNRPARPWRGSPRDQTVLFWLSRPDHVQRPGSSATVQRPTTVSNAETQLPCFQGTLETLIFVLGDRISSLGFCILRHIFWPRCKEMQIYLLIHIASVTNM